MFAQSHGGMTQLTGRHGNLPGLLTAGVQSELELVNKVRHFGSADSDTTGILAQLLRRLFITCALTGCLLGALDRRAGSPAQRQYRAYKRKTPSKQ